MNCQYCHGKMTLVDRRSFYYCQRCCTGSDESAVPVSIDGITAMPEKSDRNCCRSCPDSPQLSLGKLKFLAIEFCHSCHGVLIPETSLSRVLQTHRVDRRTRSSAPTGTRCPGCAEPMQARPLIDSSESVIETCSGCRVVWLPEGEISRFLQTGDRRGTRRPNDVPAPMLMNSDRRGAEPDTLESSDALFELLERLARFFD